MSPCLDTKYASDLLDPTCFTGTLNIDGKTKDSLLLALKDMLLIREVEQQLAQKIREGLVATPCHFCVGQEAIPVGIAKHLNSKDKVFSNHRSHGHYLSMSRDSKKLIAEIFGKACGSSKGKGGSMHLYDGDNGFAGSVPIVGGTIPVAVGAALAQKQQKSGQVAIAYFGDGACEEGGIHECLNFASVYEIPIIFVCENNLFSSHLDLHHRQPDSFTSRFAKAHNVQYEVVDGNDVVAVADVAEKLITDARENNKPAFIEAITYRWLGHVGPNEDIDVGVRRSSEQLIAWKNRDPIRRLADTLVQNKLINQDELASTTKEIELQVQKDIEFAIAADYPEESELLSHVLSSNSGGEQNG